MVGGIGVIDGDTGWDVVVTEGTSVVDWLTGTG